MITKNLALTFFVITFSSQVLSNVNNGPLSIDIFDSSNHHEELNPKYIEDVTTDTDNTKRYCNTRGECLDDDDQRSFQMMFFITASQIVLGAAIIMGLSAIVMVLLRYCSSRYARNHPNIQNTQGEFSRMGIRVSLTSLQQRIMSKLRDRPPRYETRHNYEYQRRERTRIPVLNPRASTPVTNYPPPAYETSGGDNGSVHELPPAYTITFEDTSGAVNQSFACDEDTERRQNSNCESDISNRNRSNDTVLHI